MVLELLAQRQGGGGGGGVMEIRNVIKPFSGVFVILTPYKHMYVENYEQLE